MQHTRTLALAVALGITSLVAFASTDLEDDVRVWLSDPLVGASLHDERGEVIATIEDVVVDPASESSYAIVSLGRWADMADRLHAVPWAVLRTIERDPAVPDSERRLVLTIEKERLRVAPAFAKTNWPDTTDAQWAAAVDAFYTPTKGADEARPQPVEAAARAKIVSWRVTELTGSDVTTPQSEKLGEIQLVAIDTTGRFCYVTLAVGGFLGIGEKHVAVPWAALQFSLVGEEPQRRVITLSTTKEKLERAPEVGDDEEHRTRMCGGEWILGVYEHFACAPYWQAAKSEAPALESGK